MPRPIQATIHTAALAHNLQQARLAAPDARVWAVVKANAYGHGIARVFEALKSADGFALLDLDEAQLLRNLGWRGPILLLEGVFELRELELCSRLSLWHTVHCSEQIDMLATHKTHVPHRVFLKLNSGMNRLGLAPGAYRAAWTRLNALPQVEEISFMTHFSDADGPKGIAQQMAVFNAVTHDLPGERSLSNSAAILRHMAWAGQAQAPHAGAPMAQGSVQARVLHPAQPAGLVSDWVRPGIATYGSSPDYPLHTAAQWGLQGTMTVASKIIATQALETGASVGYGSAFTAPLPMRIGVVACGYADGYPRVCPTGTPVLVAGMRTRTLGRVSMDMIAVDLSVLDVAGVAADIGSEVVLWGNSALGGSLPIDEVAHAAGTVGYELMCALAQRVPAVVA